MKLVVLNFSGNVGKTTVAVNLLKPRLDDPPIYSVESLNCDGGADGVTVERMRARRFGELQEQLMIRDSAIVDVGASNAEEFLKLMQQYHGSHEEFDFFVIPAVKEKKQIADTVNTIRVLSSIGVPRHKIRAIFNRVEVDDVVEDDFAPLFGLLELEKSFVLNPRAVIYSNEVFDRLKEVGRSLDDVTVDTVDYRAKLRIALSDDERSLCVKMVAIKRLSLSANRNLDAVFRAVFQ